MKSSVVALALLALSLGSAEAQQPRTILFIGNSYTFGYGSAARHWRASTVTDLNGEGIGGVPALFESFTEQMGLSWDVYLETRGGSAFGFHLQEKRAEITSRPWDVVVAHSFSTLDRDAPNDPTDLLATGRELSDVLHERSPSLEFYVTATWSRPDMTYPEGTPWHGKAIEVMGSDVDRAYDRLAAEVPGVKAVNPVGEAFNRAIRTGVADGNPYDGIDAGKVDLWTWDHYHASTYGYYLHALVVFGNVTGVDPLALGRGECSAYELGMSADEAEALQQVAHDELVAAGVRLSVPAGWERPGRAAACAAPAPMQSAHSNPDMPPTNDLPSPYSGRQVMPLPDGRTWGSTAGVDAAKGRDDIWAIDRCGSNSCVGSGADPLLHYDADGNLIGRMGANLFAFPHGIHVDQEGNVWVTDPLPPDGRGAGGSVGQQVTKLSPDGRVLLQLGTRMVTGTGPDQFSSPSDVVVGRNGDVFVVDGHGEGTAERVMKFDRNGNFIMQWGRPGNGPCGAGEFSSLHAIDVDSRGRLFIGDRDNNRIQIYDQNGNYLDCWYQFSRPSGIYIDAEDNLFVADSESRDGEHDGMDLAHPGWQRGIRIGSASDGSVRYFIPDPDPRGGSSAAEGVAAIGGGAAVYGAEVGPRSFVRYDRR